MKTIWLQSNIQSLKIKILKNDIPASSKVHDIKRNVDDKKESQLQILQVSCTIICNVLLELAIKDIVPFKSVTELNDVQQWLYLANA